MVKLEPYVLDVDITSQPYIRINCMTHEGIKIRIGVVTMDSGCIQKTSPKALAFDHAC